MADTPAWLSEYPEVQDDSWLNQYKEVGETPFLDLSETASSLGRAVTSLPTTTMASLSQAWEGLENPWKRSEGYLSRRQEMQALQDELAASEAEAAASGDASTVSSAIREATPSLGFSGATLLPSITAGAGTLALSRSPNAARAAAAATSGLMAYRMAGAQFLDDAKERIDAYFQENVGRAPSEQEQEEAYQELLPLARKFGAAEAGPEALGNLALGGAGKYIRRALGGKGGIVDLASNALGKVTGTKAALAGAGALASEVGTEAVTGVEQSRIQKQFEEGIMRGESPESVALAERSLGDYTSAIEEVAPATIATVGMMGAAGLGPKAISRGVQALRPKPPVEQIVEEPSMPDPSEVAKTIGDASVEQLAATGNEASAAAQADFNTILAETLGETPEPTIQPEQEAEKARAEVTPLSEDAERVITPEEESLAAKRRADLLSSAADVAKGKTKAQVSPAVTAMVTPQPVETQENAPSPIQIQESVREEPQDRIESREAEETGAGDQLRSPAEGEEEVGLARYKEAISAGLDERTASGLGAAAELGVIARELQNLTPDELRSERVRNFLGDLARNPQGTSLGGNVRPTFFPDGGQEAILRPTKKGGYEVVAGGPIRPLPGEKSLPQVKKGKVLATYPSIESFVDAVYGVTQPLTPQGKPTTATEGMVTPGGVATERDLSKPEQMTPEEVKAKVSSSAENIDSRWEKLKSTPAPDGWRLKNNPPMATETGDGRFYVLKQSGKYKAYDSKEDALESRTKGLERSFKERRMKAWADHNIAITKALQKNLPVSTAAVDAYKITLPSGYTRQGDLYVFQPQTAKAAAEGAVNDNKGVTRVGKNKTVRFVEAFPTSNGKTMPSLYAAEDRTDKRQTKVKNFQTRQEAEDWLRVGDTGETTVGVFPENKPIRVSRTRVFREPVLDSDGKTIGYEDVVRSKETTVTIVRQTPSFIFTSNGEQWAKNTIQLLSTQTTAAETQTSGGVMMSPLVKGMLETFAQASAAWSKAKSAIREQLSGTKEAVYLALAEDDFTMSRNGNVVEISLPKGGSDAFSLSGLGTALDKYFRFGDAKGIAKVAKKAGKPFQITFGNEKDASNFMQYDGRTPSQLSEDLKRLYQQLSKSQPRAAEKQTPVPLREGTGAAGVVQSEPVEGSIPTDEKVSPETESESSEKLDTVVQIDRLVQSGAKPEEMDKFVKSLTDEQFNELVASEAFDVDPKLAIKPNDTYDAKRIKRRKFVDAVNASTKEVRKTAQQVFQEEEAAVKKQQAGEEMRSKAIDSIIGASEKKKRKFGQVTNSDAIAAVAMLVSSKDVPGVLTTWTGTKDEFLRDPANQTADPEIYARIKAGELVEGFFNKGRAYVFLDGIGVSDEDMLRGEQMSVTPQVAAVRRVLLHESLVHRGIHGLPLRHRRLILNWVRQNSTPAELDDLAKLYTEYANWRNSDYDFEALAEELLAKKVDSLTEIPKDGPMAKLMDILRQIWDFIVGYKREPTLSDLKSVVKLLKSGAEALANDRLKDGGEVKLSIRAFHGTPHKVDKFTTAKIGTGEGAQAYGWGLYFAQNKGVAKSYQEALSGGNRLLINGKTLEDATVNLTPTQIKWAQEVDHYVDEMQEPLERAKGYVREGIKDALERKSFERFASTFGVSDSSGNLYTVELLPDESEFLDWDKPLSEQSEKVKAALKAVQAKPVTADGLDMGGGSVIRDNRRGQFDKSKPYPWLLVSGKSAFGLSQADVDRMTKAQTDATGENIYTRLTASEGSQKAASEYLASLGIPGIRYLDGGSRPANVMDARLLQVFEQNNYDVEKTVAQMMRSVYNTPKQKEAIAQSYREQLERGKPTRNYVIFDENLVRILEENGQSLTPPEGSDIRFSRPQFSSDTSAALSAGSEAARSTLYSERDMDIREAIRRAYESMPKTNSVAVPIGELFAKTEELMPGVTQEEFSLVLQDLFEDNGAVLQEGESDFFVTTPEGRRAGFVVVMPRAAKASRIKAEDVAEASKSFQADLVEAGKGRVDTAAYQGRPLKGVEIPEHNVNAPELYDRSVSSLVDFLEKKGYSLIEIADSIQNRSFQNSIGLLGNENVSADMAQKALQAVGMVLQERLQIAANKESDPIKKRKLEKAAKKNGVFWSSIETGAGQLLQATQYFQGDPKRKWMFLFNKAEKEMADKAKDKLDTITGGGTQPVTDMVNQSEEAAADEATKQIEESVEEYEYANLLNEGEDGLEGRRKTIWERAKMILRRLAMYARADKMDVKTGSKASLSAEQRKELDELNAILRMPKAERDKAREKDLAEFDDLMAEFLGLESDAKTTEQKKTRQKRKKMVDTAKKRAEAGKSIDISDTESAVKIVLREMGKARPGKQVPLTKLMPWKDIIAQKAKTVEEYRQRILDAMMASDAFKEVSDEDKAKIADIFAKQWDKKRTDILDRMLEREIDRKRREGSLSEAAAKALQKSRNKIIELANLGGFDNDDLMKVLGEKFGIKTGFSEAEKARISELADKLQDETLNPAKRNKLAMEFAVTLAGASEIPVSEIIANWWTSSVLFGPQTIFSIGAAFVNGAYSITTIGTRRMLADLTRGDVRGAIEESILMLQGIAKYLGAFKQAGRRAWSYLWTGNVDVLGAAANDILGEINSLEELKRFKRHKLLAENLAKDPRALRRYVGMYLRFVNRLLTSLDAFNVMVTKAGTASLALRMSGMSTDNIIKAEKMLNLKAYKDQVIRDYFDNKAPTTQAEKALVDSYAEAEMYRAVDQLGGKMENADYLASESAMTMNPTGLGGFFYRSITGLDSKMKKAAEDYLEKAKKEWTTEKDLESALFLGLAYLRQFAVQNLGGVAGYKFIRFASNKFNQGISYLPMVGLLRTLESKGDDIKGKEAFIETIHRNQVIGAVLTLAAIAVVKALEDEPDDEERGNFWNGGWQNLTPDQKKQMLAKGQKEYTMGFKFNGRWYVFNYQNWPLNQVLAAIGSMSDQIRFSPKQWEEKGPLSKSLAGIVSGLKSTLEIPALSQLGTLVGNRLASKDPTEQTVDRLSNLAAGWVGGFVPRILKDLDFATQPETRKYKTLWEKTASHIPIYRRYVGEDYYDILGQPIKRNVIPGSREFMMGPTEPEYKILGALNSRNIFLTPANAEYRMVGKGRNRRRLTQEEADAYSLETGKGYRQMLLRYGQRALQMPTERARAFLSDKADEVRDRALKKVYRGYKS